MPEKAKKKSQATHHDADLLLKLYDLRREAVMRRARAFMTTEFWPQTYEEFKDVATGFGAEKNAWFRQVISYWDMAAVLVIDGILDEDLFFKTCGEPYFLYTKFKPFIEQIRKDLNNPDFMARIEQLATATPQARERIAAQEAFMRMRGEANKTASSGGN
jgi:hypothetical protein